MQYHSMTQENSFEPSRHHPQLYYVIGPSGAGKDTLIDAIRAAFIGEIIVAHRYITRAADAGGENHVALTTSEFNSRQQQGLFSLSWQAHGLHYGVGMEVKAWLSQGLSVVVNGSRAELEQAKVVFGDQLLPVLVAVDTSVLRDRLMSRGRETPQQIEQRLQRAQAYAPEGEGAWIINNSGTVEESIVQFTLLHERRVLNDNEVQSAKEQSVKVDSIEVQSVGIQ
ncbi:ribose 1,5-bisphosphokinase [Vibrio sp. 10N.261.51.F12]|uniref:ribose 1,5-bisphosphokinase n=1 Tax=Vibrio sp. 10N.261.51.F12 TaxID=3229679 RepID=UPI003551AB57